MQTTQLSAIDKALAAAKARKAARTATTADDSAPADAAPAAKKEPTLTLEERAAAKMKRDEERAARKAAAAEKLAADAAARAEKKAARAAKKAAIADASGRGPAHMKKVDRARSKLPALNEGAAERFNDAVSALTIPQIEALGQHLLVQARALKTLRANTAQPLPMGATVRITGGDPKFIGMVGTVFHTQRLHAKVRVPELGDKKHVYIYTGEAEVVTPAGE